MLLIHTYFNFFLRFMGNKLQSNIIYYHTKAKLNHYNVMKEEQITYYST